MRDRMVWWLVVPPLIGAMVAALGLYLTPGLLPHRIADALDLTGRWSFGFFWLAYTGAWMGNHRRECGLAFASAHLVHIALVIWLFRISPTPPEAWPLVAFFSLGLGFTYLLAALSWQRFIRLVGRDVAKHVRTVGMHYILLAFAYDFIVGPLLTASFDLRHVVKYLPFAVATLAAPWLRLLRLYPSSALASDGRNRIRLHI